jgi:hypothetical protein
MKKPRKLYSLRGFSFSSYFGGWTGIEPVTRGFSIPTYSDSPMLINIDIINTNQQLKAK